MKWLRLILSHSIFVAFCAAALVLQTVQLLHLYDNIFIYAFVFFATLFSYNVYWLVSKKNFGSVFYNAIFYKKEWSKILLLCIAATGMLVAYLQSQLYFWYVLPSLLLTAMYALPLLPFKWLRFTRRLGPLKTTLLAFTWTYVTAYIPIQKAVTELDGADIFILTRRFLFMLMLCILFDSRDSRMDKIRGLHSLATDISPRLLGIINLLIFLILFASNFWAPHFGISTAQAIALQVSTVALLVAFLYARKPRGYFFYYFFIDGLMLFSAAATYIAGI